MAVDAVLASTLWTAEQRVGTGDASDAQIATHKPQKLATAHAALDTTLNGGLEHGQIHCISADVDSASKELCYALLTSHLLSSPEHQATVVDTTNSFDVKRLHGVIVATLRRSQKDGDDARSALQALERVRVMTAFDFIGLTECISELRDSLEAPSPVAAMPAKGRGKQARKNTVVDDSDAEDDMLDAAVLSEVAILPVNQAANTPLPKQSSSGRDLLIIDNIAHAAGPLLKSNHSQGQALLSSFMRSLSHLTRAHNIATLLINSATTYPNSTSADCQSIFASCLLRPALGRSFSYLVDTHMLLHRLPLTAEDAKVMYGTQTSGAAQRQVRMVNVLEVLHDRSGSRVGRWAAFGTSAEGVLESVT